MSCDVLFKDEKLIPDEVTFYLPKKKGGGDMQNKDSNVDFSDYPTNDNNFQNDSISDNDNFSKNETVVDKEITYLRNRNKMKPIQ